MTDNVKEWLAGPFYKVVCKVNENEFIRAKEIEDNEVITESSINGEEVAIAFKPREIWPNEFKYFRLYRLIYMDFKKKKECI